LLKGEKKGEGKRKRSAEPDGTISYTVFTHTIREERREGKRGRGKGEKNNNGGVFNSLPPSKDTDDKKKYRKGGRDHDMAGKI